MCIENKRIIYNLLTTDVGLYENKLILDLVGKDK